MCATEAIHISLNMDNACFDKTMATNCTTMALKCATFAASDIITTACISPSAHININQCGYNYNSCTKLEEFHYTTCMKGTM